MIITPRHTRTRTARPRRAVLFSCQGPLAALLPPPRFCLRPIRLASRTSSVGAQIRSQRTLPTTMRRPWDGSLDRAASTPIARFREAATTPGFAQGQDQLITNPTRRQAKQPQVL